MRRSGIIILFAAVGCTEPKVTVRTAEPTEGSDLPAAAGAPAQFMPQPGGPPLEVGDCPAGLTDPGSGASLRLLESRSKSRRETRGDTLFVAITSHGDYAVTPEGSFGAGAGLLLRVDCATYRPLGIASAD